MRSTPRPAPLLLVAPLALACAGPAAAPDERAERLAYERDHERCLLQAENTRGVVQRGDYVACMHLHGWKNLPE